MDGAQIHALFNEQYLNTPAGWQLRAYELNRESDVVHARISIGDEKGAATVLAGEGRGGVEALVAAIKRRSGQDIAVEGFDEFALNEGTDARAMGLCAGTCW